MPRAKIDKRREQKPKFCWENKFSFCIDPKFYESLAYTFKTKTHKFIELPSV